MNCKIEQATEADVPQIVQLWIELMKLHQTFGTLCFSGFEKFKTDFETLLQAKIMMNDDIVLVAKFDDKVVGFITAEITTTIFSDHNHEINLCKVDDIMVDEKYRRQKIGYALIDNLKDCAARFDAYSIELKVYAKNEKSQLFYAAIGFEETFKTLRLNF
jgi:ribosomal protein S18 acetylase RimI-like enzyme